MIKLQATAIIHSISPVIEIPSKTGGQNFQKRELILNDSWVSRDNQTVQNFVVIEFSGDKIGQLDAFIPGQRVTVEAIITGREHNGRIFNTIRGQSVQHYQQPAQQAPGHSIPQPQYQQAPGYQTPPTPGYPQQTAAPAYPAQQQYAQQPQYSPTPAYPPQPASPGVNDLPFAH